MKTDPIFRVCASLIIAAYGGAIVLGIMMFIWTAVGSDLRRKLFTYWRRRTQPEGPLP